MDRDEILKSPEYWITRIQTSLYQCADKFMSENNMNRMQLAEHMGVSKGYISQLLNGDYDHRLSKLVELAISFGYIPKIDFVKIDEYITKQKFVKIYKTAKANNFKYSSGSKTFYAKESRWEHLSNTKRERGIA